MSNCRFIPRQWYCSISEAARALGVPTRKIADLLGLGELEGKFGFHGGYWLSRTLVRVESIHQFILRGGTE